MQTTLEAAYVKPFAPDAAALSITGLLESVAAELIIFVCTVAVAVVIKHSGFHSTSCAAAAAAETRRNVARTSSSSTSAPHAKRPTSPSQPQMTLPRVQAPVTVDEVVAQAAGGPAKAFALYAELRALPKSAFAEALQQSKHSAEAMYGALVSCATRGKRPELVHKLFDDMQRLEFYPSLSLYESAMRLLAGQHRFREALDVYERLEADGLQPSHVTLGCLVNFAAEVGDLDLAISFFDRLSAEGVPNIRAYSCALRILSKQKDWPKSLRVYRDCQERGGGVDGIILNLTLATGVAARALGPAKALLQEATERTPQIVDVISFNTVLKACAQRNEVDTALTLLARMKEVGVTPNAITFNTAMDAAVRCSERGRSRRGAADEVWRIYAAMRSSGLRPDKFTCSTLVKGVALFDGPQLSLLVDALDEVGSALPRLANALETLLDRAAVLRARGQDGAEVEAVTQRVYRLMESNCT